MAAPTLTRLASRATLSGGVDRRWWGLGVIATAQLMIALDATVVNIALPSAQASLGFADADRQWIVTAYTLTLGGLLLLGGRVADSVAVGRRRALVLGLVGFAAASALSGAAASLGMLIGARALQGAFAALLAPTALSTLALMFTERRERARAFGIYGAIAASGGAIGLLLGGVLTQYLSWRWCLYVNVPIALAAAAGARALLPDARRPAAPYAATHDEAVSAAGDASFAAAQDASWTAAQVASDAAARVGSAGTSRVGSAGTSRVGSAGTSHVGSVGTPHDASSTAEQDASFTAARDASFTAARDASLAATRDASVGAARVGSTGTVRLGSGSLALPAETRAPRFDALGLVLGSGGLVALVLACGQAARLGWSAPTVVLLMALGGLALALFVWQEARAEAPLLPLGIVLDRPRGAAYASTLLAAAGMFGAFLFLTYTLQVGLGFAPLGAGLAFLPMTAASVIAGTLVAPRVLLRTSPRALMATGFGLAAGGMLVLGRVQVGSDYATGVLPAEVLLGLGVASVMMPASQLATSRVDQRTAGAASATLNAAQQVGASLGTTLLNTLAATATAGYLASRPASPPADGLLHGYAAAAPWGVVVLLVGGLVALSVPAREPSVQAR
jgi:MFS family permease